MDRIPLLFLKAFPDLFPGFGLGTPGFEWFGGYKNSRAEKKSPPVGAGWYPSHGRCPG